MACYCKVCKEARERWRKANKDKINAKKREKRLKARLERELTADKKCLNCERIIAYTLGEKKRAYLYCRACIENHPDEVNRDKCRRSYWKRKGVEAPYYKRTVAGYVRPAWLEKKRELCA